MGSRPGLLVTDYVSRPTAMALADGLLERRPDAAVHRATTPAETRELIVDVEAIVTSQLPEDLLELGEALRWVQVLSSGVDRYPLRALADRGIALTNAAGVHAEPIAEHVLGFMLLFERGLHRSVRHQSDAVWERVDAGELRAKTVGVIGLGAIGGRVARLCSLLGMTVLGTKRDLGEVPPRVDEVFAADEHHEVLARADYVVVCCPLTEETRGLIGSAELRVMGPDAVLINVGRGEVVDQDALVGALQKGRLAGAGLDVFETEPLPRDSALWRLSNVVITPHMAGSSPRRVDRWLELVETNYAALADDRLGELENRVV